MTSGPKKKNKNAKQPAPQTGTSTVPNAALSRLIESSPLWYYWEEDENRRFTLLRGAIFDSGQIDPRALLGKTCVELGIVPAGGEDERRGYENLLAAREAYTELLFQMPGRNGERRYVRVTGHPTFDPDGRFIGYRGISHDVTRSVLAEQRLRAEHRVATLLEDASRISDVAPKLVQAICETWQWNCGAYWALEPETRTLECIATWGENESGLRDFLAATQRMSPADANTAGVLAPVAAAREPAWISDVTTHTPYDRKNAAKRARLHRLLALPIVTDTEVVGVLEFYGREALPPDKDTLKAARALGTRIGQSWRRMKDAEDLTRFRAATDMSGDAIFLVDNATLRYVDFNGTARSHSGYTREELLKLGPADMLSMDREQLRRDYDAVIARYPHSVKHERIVHNRYGEWTVAEVHYRALRAGNKWYIISVSRHIHERKLAEQALKRLGRMYNTLSASNEAILRAKTIAELYQCVCEAAVQSGQFVTMAVLLPDGAARALHVAAVTGEHAQALQETRIDIDDTGAHGRDLVGSAFRGLIPVVSSDVANDERLHPWREAVQKGGWATAATIPLVRDGAAVGVLFFLSRYRSTFDDDAVKLLQRMAQNVVYAWDNLAREAALRQSEARYRSILEDMSEGYWETDLPGNFTFFNDTICNNLGYTREELSRMRYTQYFDEATVKLAREIFLHVYRTGEPARLAEWGYIRKDGARGTFETSVQLVYDENGKRIGFRGVTRDTTERKKAEAALRASEEKYRTIIETIHDAYYENDLTGNLTFCNTALCRMLGYRTEELISMNYRDYVAPASVDALRDAYLAVYQTGVPSNAIETRLRRKDGAPLDVEGSVELIRDARGAPTGFRGIVRDITERRREANLLVLEHAVTRKLAEGQGMRATLQGILRTICESEGWQSSAYWSFEPSRGVARWLIGWTATDASAETVRLYEQNREVPLGGPLARSYATGQAVWVRDIREELSSAWRERYDATKERATFVLPVIVEGATVGALGFASEAIREPDERLLQTAKVIGHQIGQFIKRKEAERVLRESEARFRALTELSSDWYWEQDAEFRFTRFEGRLVNEHPKMFSALLGKRTWDVLETEGSESHRKYQETHQPFRDFVAYSKTPNGQRIYVSVSGEPMFGRDGRFLGYRGVGRDITNQRVAEERIQYLATHDALTGLPNRVMFSQLLNVAIQTAQSDSTPFAVVFIDLDRFKVINDTLGHETGDKLLQQAALRLQQTLRTSDVIARLGGDEFVVLLRDVGEPRDVAAIARKILSVLMRPVEISDQECRVTASIGISMYPADAKDEPSLMKNADMAMYLAKEEGKNNFQFYSSAIEKRSLQRLTLETNLRRALENNELSLHYQPKLDLRTGRITGVEALLRWNSPTLGPVSPVQFIPIAEETGLIVPIGQWVLRTACAQSVAWQRAGLPAVCMAVNLSARQFNDENLLDDIAAALEDSGLAPYLLELEITEGMVMHDTERAAQLLEAIKRKGVRIAIDDFGTGYSSLAQIKRFPLDTLKVDRSFIRDIPEDPDDKAITEAIVAMAKTLDLLVVAEGVETREQVDFLRSLACDEMQGYYFSKPIEPENFARLLSQHRALPH